MRFRSFGLVTAIALATACAGHEPAPVGDLRSASAAVDGSTVWVIGGTVVSDEVFAEMTTPSYELPEESWDAVLDGASEHAVQYDLEGHVLQDVDLGDLDLGLIPSLGDLTALSVSGGTVLAGTACIQQSDEVPGGCLLTPVALALHDGRIERVMLDTAHGGADDIRVIGAVGSKVLVAVATQAGAALGSPNEAELFAIDPAGPDATRIPVPPGVMFVRALCLRGNDLVALTIELDHTTGRAAGTLQAGVVDASGALGAPVSIPVSDGFPGAAAIVCRDDGVTVLELPPPHSFSSDTTLALHDVDLAARTVTASSELSLEYTAVPSLESIGGDLLLIEQYWTDDARPTRWSAGDLGPPGPAASMNRGDVVVVGHQLFDISGLLAQVPGDDAEPPVELAVPPLR